MQVRIC